MSIAVRSASHDRSPCCSHANFMHTPVFSRRKTFVLPLAWASAGQLLTSACDARPATSLTPEDFGATSYTTREAAKRGVDATAAVQRMADEAARRGIGCGGAAGRWYATSTVDWPSGSTVTSLNLLTRSGMIDAAPFTIEAVHEPRRDLSFTDCMVDGNRQGQHDLRSSGGDGRRCGWLLSGHFPGAIQGITLTRCRAWNCATDGFMTWCNGVEQRENADYFFGNIKLIDCDFQWNGRHGGSLMGVDGFHMQGGRLKNNGKDLAMTKAPIRSNGTWARVIGSGVGTRRYGRPWDCESSLPGEGYQNVTFSDVDMRDNVGGLLFHHYFYAGGRLARRLRIHNCLLSDPEGQTTGDGALLFYAVDARTGRPFDRQVIAFDEIEAIDNQYERQGVAVYSADHVIVAGGRATMTGPGFWGYYATLNRCGGNVRIDVPSNRYRIWKVDQTGQGLIDGRFSSGRTASSASS